MLVLLKRNDHCKTLSFDLIGYLPSFAYIFPKVSRNHRGIKFPTTFDLCMRFSCVVFSLEVHFEGLTSLYGHSGITHGARGCRRVGVRRPVLFPEHNFVHLCPLGVPGFFLLYRIGPWPVSMAYRRRQLRLETNGCFPRNL